ncbi:hypothetical protein ABT095_30185 [Kitasatospora sp. NPDC002227]|uniref:hypothetical protein n=1 Tax=Kitasatospora sp. NPDC002227 TaxID=3154773 RepID=UPI00331C0FBE
MRTTRAFDVANRLARATGGRARISVRPGKGFLVEAALSPELSDEAQLAVLDVLHDADRFGHHYTPTAQHVWAEIDQEPQTP